MIIGSSWSEYLASIVSCQVVWAFDVEGEVVFSCQVVWDFDVDSEVLGSCQVVWDFEGEVLGVVNSKYLKVYIFLDMLSLCSDQM